MKKKAGQTGKGDGVIIIFTGAGKGKTTAALGCALRASGYGMKTLVVQFMKGEGNSGETMVCPGVLNDIEIRSFGAGFLLPGDDPDAHRRAAEEAWAYVEKRMNRRTYDILVLDELAVVLDHGLLVQEKVIECLAMAKGDGHIIITGRNAPSGLMEIADVITEMRDVKHMYRNGRPAVRGLDY